MTPKAIKNYIIALPGKKPTEYKTASGFIIPTGSAEPTRATVVSVGSDVKDVKEGDIIAYRPREDGSWPARVVLNGEEYIKMIESGLDFVISE